jgi:hypothetical protein
MRRSLLDVFALDAQNAWAVGNGGVVLHTSDGTNWNIEANGMTSNMLRAVYFTSPTNGYALGNKGTLLKYGPLPDQPPILTTPTLTTTPITNTTTSTAVAGGNVTDDGGANITERGVVYGLSTNPTIGTDTVKVSDTTGTGSYTVNLTNLTPGTTYHIRAYATNSQGTSYGEDVAFATAAPDVPVASVVLNKHTVEISSGSSEQLAATVLPANATNKNITWSVESQSASNVATVSSNGLVTANNIGTATIRATSNDNSEIYDECVVTVCAPLSSNASLLSITLEDVTITPSFDPDIINYLGEAAYETENTTVTPTLEDENANATVNGNPLVEGISVVALNVGDNTIAVEVTAEDSTTKVYTFKVKRASNNTNNQDDTTTPTNPTNTTNRNRGGSSVPTKPLNLRLVSSTGSINLAWDKNTESNLDGYNIYRSVKENTNNNSNTPVKLNSTLLKENEYKDTTAVPGTTYIYYVVAVNKSNRQSDKSNTVEAALTQVKSAVIFSDIAPNAWYENYVSDLLSRNILNGYSNGTFAPDKEITREEFAKMICLAMGWELISPDKPTYPDTTKERWSYRYVETASKHGAIIGYPEGVFKPNQIIRRDELTAIVTRAKALQDTTGQGFTDVPKDTWAYKYILTAKNKQIVNGNPNGLFEPARPSTRAEGAAAIYRMMGVK